MIPASRAACEALDARDPLAFARARFAPPPGVTYLDGNSLGVLPRATAARLADTVEREWGRGLIGSWNAAGWIEAPARVGRLIAPLVGADPEGVIAADTTSANLFKLAAAALELRPERGLVLCDAAEFPTDLYILQGLARFVGREVEVRALPQAELGPALDAGEAALLVLSHVNYVRGDVRDMAAWTARAHAAGALALWDLSHSTGCVPVELGASGADFATGCGYKYLNGGPGAPAFLYVAPRWRDRAGSPLSGWMGHAAPFAFEGGYRPGEGMARWLCGTPPVLGLAALEEGVRTFEGVDLAAVAAKSRALSELFLHRVDALAPGAFAMDAPPAAERGGHVVLGHPHAYALVQALIEAGVVGDFRRPDLLRFGFAAPYLTFAEVWDAAALLARVLEDGRWREPRFAVRAAVT